MFAKDRIRNRACFERSRLATLEIIEQHLLQFLGQIAEHGTHLPRFVTQEFDDYLTCGRLPDSYTGSLAPATIKKTC